MPMRPREKHVTGFVKFPVDDPTWRFSAEGGMFVRVVVPAKRDLEGEDRLIDSWMECCGGFCAVRYDETLQNSDETMRRLWPNLFDGDGEPRELGPDEGRAENSVPLLACVTLGSTGWAGWSEDLGRYWTCGFDDLDGDGRRIVESLRTLYPAHDVLLTTWLDT